jgi:RimJ/RimL family protein N-acetyltransferase
MEQTLHWADEQGIRRIEVGVEASNDRAIALYKRFGFEQEGIRQGALLVNNIFLDEILMARVTL